MKKLMIVCLVLCLLLAGCGKTQTEPAPEAPVTEPEITETPVTEVVEPEVEEPAEEPEVEEPEVEEPAEEPEEPALTVFPLPEAIMDNLTDATLAVSLEEGDAYVDDTGAMQMDLKIYTYDKYDMIDIAMLKVGDTIVTHAGEVEITALEQGDTGLLINGGLEQGGLDLIAGNSMFFEVGYNDSKNWYEVGEATIRVSTEFEYKDTSDPDAGELSYPPGAFLVGEVPDYNFTPNNTTIRIEAGQIIAMERIYTP